MSPLLRPDFGPLPRGLRRGFVIGFTVSALLVLAITGFAMLELQRARRVEREEGLHERMVYTVGAFEAALERKAGALRGYLITGEPQFLDRASAARRDFRARLDWLRRVAASGASRALVDRLNASERAYEVAWERHLAGGALSRADNVRFFNEQVTPRHEAVLRDLRELSREESAALDRTHRSSERKFLRTGLAVLATGGGALLLTLMITGLLARRLASLYATEQTERQRAEDAAQALARSETQFRGVFEGSLDALVIADDSGNLVDANPAACDLFGLPSCADLQGRSIGEFAVTDYPFDRTWEEFRRLGVARGEFRLRRPDGSLRDTEFSATADIQPGRHLSALRDVTERKRTEQALLESQGRFRTVADAAPVLFWMSNPDGERHFFNKGWLDFTGRSTEQEMGDGWRVGVHPDDAPDYFAAYRSALGERRAFQSELRLRRADGAFRWVLDTAAPLPGAGDGFGGLIGSCIDVTDRRETEQAIRDSESRKAAIFNSALDAIVTIDGSGRVLEFNPAAEAVFGYTREEVLGREMAELIIPPALREAHRAGMESHLTAGGGPVLGRRIEMPAMRRDGTEFPVELSILRLPGDGPPVFTGFLRDITEPRRAEAERVNLLQLERKARAAAEAAEGRSAFLAEASAVLASSLDYETTLKRVAKLAVPRIADWCVVDMLSESRDLQPLAVSHVDHNKVELVYEIWRRFPRSPDADAGPARVVRTGRSEITEQISEEMLRRVSRGEEHFQMVRQLDLASSICVPLEARGQILGALTFAYEAGGRRYVSDDLAFAESLAHRASLAIDNARLLRQARDAVRLRDEFLSIASHELKTPVTTLQLQIQSLLRRASGEDGQAILPRLSTAQRQVERLHKLIERLLDISRLTAGRLELDLESVDLQSLVQEVVARFDEELQRAGCRVTLRGVAPAIGRWDRSRLDQVVTNLLSNAIKYGSGKPIVITLDGDEGVARLEIRDEGIGIAAESLPRIFERFERAVSERHYAGLGLGLWIVRQIVEALGGSVRAVSVPGEGSTFAVELPRNPPPQHALGP